MRIVRQAAMNVPNPSGKDLQVVAQTIMTELEAQAELARKQLNLNDEEDSLTMRMLEPVVDFTNPGVTQLSSEPRPPEQTAHPHSPRQDSKREERGAEPSSNQEAPPTTVSERIAENIQRRKKLLKAYQSSSRL